MESEPTYTIYIRLPFPRGDFVDPPPVNWDSSKDEALWNILSGVSKTEIDWDAIASKFEVTVDFLLQQVTYLTERHASQVRAQMRKATVSKGSAAPSPVPGSDSAAAMAADMRRTASGGGGPGGRAPSSLSVRKDSPLPKNEGGAGATGNSFTVSKQPPFSRPQVSRASSSSNTAAHRQGGGGSSTPRAAGERPGSARSQRKRLSSLPITTAAAVSDNDGDDDGDNEEEGHHPPTAAANHLFGADEDPNSPGPAESSSATSSAESSPAQSRIIRRPPRFQPAPAAAGGGAAGVGAGGGGGGTGGTVDGPSSPDEVDEDDDAEPAFLPFKGQGQYSDPSATLRDPRDFVRRGQQQQQQQQQQPPQLDSGSGGAKSDHRANGAVTQSQTSDSSTGSAALVNKSPARGHGHRHHHGHGGHRGPLSPRRTAELSGRSPSSGGKGKGQSKDGSDGGTTPSMGSSFSDLDDASVTQSALEEALASKMQNEGTIGSRMSTLGQAFRSRYLPKGNQPAS